MISGHEFADRLERAGFDFFAGVPCSLIDDLIATLEVHPRLPYINAVREDVAVGLAAGAWFGGRKPAVLMQNSGLGTSLNALASLSLMYGLPALLVVTWRGHGGKDAPEHILMGAISPELLTLLGVPHRVVTSESLAEDIIWAAGEMEARLQPVALLVPPGVVEIGGVERDAQHTPGASTPSSPAAWRQPRAGTSSSPATLRNPGAEATPSPPTNPPSAPPAQMSRLAALAAAVKPIGSEPLIHANGYICRESYSLGDRPQNFYMIGSMGLAPAIGLGLALSRRDRTAVVFDGDGNVLMNLGTLAMVGALRPPKFVHCVFDNEAYGSTGNQESLSRDVRLDRLAEAAGYRTSVAVAEAPEVTAVVRRAMTTEGPHFILIKVTRAEAEVPRIPHSPHAIRDRFRGSVLGG